MSVEHQSHPSPGITENDRSVVVASYPTYPEAQRVVDHLSDAGFAVRSVSIVGRGVSIVEKVLGRMTKRRAAVAGAASGAWMGLFVGLLLGLFATGIAWVTVLLTGAALGALWGAAIGFVAHWSTRGQRDFSSVQTLAAERYDIVVAGEHATEATQLLAVPDVA